MDYLDTKKEFRHHVLLFTGYVCIAIAVALTAIVLLYQSYGFGVTKKGDITQSGLVFFSSQPQPADILINGQPSKYSTNTRMAILSGIYKFELNRKGYHPWDRRIEVDGGDVHHFDYPFLIPKELTDKPIKNYLATPSFTTQSPDRRWLAVLQPGSMTNFEVFDLKNPTKEPAEVSLPANVITKAVSSESYELVSWASDNDHFLLKHNVDGKYEYILTSRTKVNESRNINKELATVPAKLTLLDKKFDKYVFLENGILKQSSLSEPTKHQVIKEQVLAYQTYGSDTVLYATNNNAEDGKIAVRLSTVGDKDDQYDIINLPVSPDYLLDLTKYDGKMYVVAAATNQQKTYVFQDPVGQIRKSSGQMPAPVQVLHVDKPGYLSFSNSAQFVMVQNATHYGVYDIENKRGYNYEATNPIDPPATHATWMDGSHLTYVSGGRTLIFDYDHNNAQSLLPASPNYLPAFAPDYKFVYTFRSTPQSGINLVQVSLRSKADQ